MSGSIFGGMGGGGGGMAAYQTQLNQQQIDAASAATSRENTDTMVRKLVEDTKQKQINETVEKTQFYSRLTDKINLGQ